MDDPTEPLGFMQARAIFTFDVQDAGLTHDDCAGIFILGRWLQINEKCDITGCYQLEWADAQKEQGSGWPCLQSDNSAYYDLCPIESVIAPQKLIPKFTRQDSHLSAISYTSAGRIFYVPKYGAVGN